jgi:hypothetical protein
MRDKQTVFAKLVPDQVSNLTFITLDSNTIMTHKSTYISYSQYSVTQISVENAYKIYYNMKISKF